jgi:hypothetical protein
LQFEGKPLRELLIEAIRYGEQPEVRARLTRAMNNALDKDKVRNLLEEHALVHDAMDATLSVRHNVEFGVAIILKALRETTRRNVCPTRTAFAHARNSDLREFERFYLCPVEFGRAANEGTLACRFRRSRGCSATRGHLRSITHSSAGRGSHRSWLETRNGFLRPNRPGRNARG